MLKTVGNPSTRSGNQTILNGNLVIGTAGNGIDFSANSNAPGAQSELLDDYERGTFTAVIADASTGGNTSTTATGYYTKIGNIITCEIDLVNISTAGLTAANTLHVRGLPFNSANNQSAAFPVLVSSITFSGYVEAYMGNSRTFFTFYSCASNAAIALIKVQDLTSGSARIIMGFSYRT